MSSLKMLMFKFGLIAFGFIVGLTCVSAEEKQCLNKFEYEYNVLERLILLGQKMERQENVSADLRKELEDARRTIDELNDQLRFSDGSTYIRWGRTTCPDGAALVYVGSAAGGLSTHTGAAANTLCLSNEPEWDEYIDGFSGGTRIYGAEYGDSALSGWNHLNHHDIPCAVCRVRHGNVLMISGQKSCHGDYVLQYSGYLMAGSYGDAASSEYICMDRKPEKDDSGAGDTIGKEFRLVQGECGALKCPPYVEGREITCVVCSFSASAQSLQPIS